MPQREKKAISNWDGETIAPGETRNVKLAVGESYSGMTVRIPIQIRRARDDGPTVFVTAALHGDEINGTGAVRHLIMDEAFQLNRGNLIIVPVMNILAFDRHSRYLPDRRDLNRCFPGTKGGSLASRLAHKIFEEIVLRADYGIDLHTASIRKTNYPNVRGELNDPGVARIARAFGSEIVVNGRGPSGAFRREACQAGCPTIIMEGGEVWKVEPTIVESAVRGIKNVLRELQMIAGKPEIPEQQVSIEKTRWIRADRGGFLQFHVEPGAIVESDQALTSTTSLLGRERSVLHAPFDGVVIGMTTLPAVSPGEPVCHIGELPHGTKLAKFRRLRKDDEGLEGRLVENLASNVFVVEPRENGD